MRQDKVEDKTEQNSHNTVTWSPFLYTPLFVLLDIYNVSNYDMNYVLPQ